jgi:transcriptional regulator with XRE-family HTH domain
MNTERLDEQRQHVAKVVLRERLRRGWNATTAAAHLGVSDSQWSRWEGAVSLPRPQAMKRLTEFFGLTDDWMIPTTLEHPSPTVELDERLRRIEELQQQMIDERREERRQFEDVYRALTEGVRDGGSGSESDRDHGQQRAIRDN